MSKNKVQDQTVLPDSKIWFEAILYPQRSLSKLGFIVLMTVLPLLSFAIGLIFYIKGAWPIFGFMGVDVLLIYWAFKIHFKSGQAAEIIRLTKNELNITLITHKGHKREWIFNPYWVSVAMACPPNMPKNLGESLIQIRSHGQGIFIGGELTQDERIEVMHSLNQAIKQSRGL